MPATETIPSPTDSAPQSWQPCFDGHSAAYQRWRRNRISRQEQLLESARATEFLHWSTTQAPATTEQPIRKIGDSVLQHGYALYQWDVEAGREPLAQMHRALGLALTDTGVITGVDHFSLLENLAGVPRARFVPYSNRAMNWHTDGYYNDASAEVRCFTLHCVAPAAAGGTLSLLDTELLLIALYDDNPDLVTTLSHPQAMTLPANKDHEGHNRPDRAVPIVFQRPDGSLGTRFTTRQKNINWRCDNTRAAAERAAELINLNTQWQVHIKLGRGQGIITRNILHCREAFEDIAGVEKRQMLRARYLETPRTTISHSDDTYQGVHQGANHGIGD